MSELEHEWLEVVWDNYDSLAASFDSHELPPYLTGEDVIQDMVEFFLKRGFPASTEVIPFFYTAGIRHIRKLIRREEGRQGAGTGEEVKRHFVSLDAEDTVELGTESQVDFTLDRHMEAVDELAKRMEVLTDRQRSILYMRFFLGYTFTELAEHFGVMRATVTQWANEARRLARSVEYDNL